MMNGTLAVIPARENSTRFPLKILTPILNKPMIQHVWEAALRVESLNHTVIATDSQKIQSVVKGFGGRCVLTPPFQSGLDRVAYVASQYDYPWIMNIQGDEPLLNPPDLNRLIHEMSEHSSYEMGTLAIRTLCKDELDDINIVKVLTSQQGEALYFSRKPLTVDRDGHFLKHIGIYLFRKDILKRLSSIPRSNLEKVENLEQLRAIENGIKIRVVLAEKGTVPVDHPADIRKVEKTMLERKNHFHKVSKGNLL